jgi:hypothetical protein
MLIIQRTSFFIFIITALLMSNTARPANAGAFGLEQGTSKESLDIEKELSPFTYKLKSVNKPHPEFVEYFALVSPKEGLCIIIGNGKTYSNDSYGTNVRSTYSNIKSQLDRLYGKGKPHDSIESNLSFKESSQWLMSLMQNEIQYVTFWSKKDNSLKDGVVAISLGVEALSTDESYIQIKYDFSNVSRCRAEIAKIEAESL